MEAGLSGEVRRVVTEEMSADELPRVSVLALGGTIAAYDPDDPPTRSGSRVRGGAPRNVYRTADGQYVAVSGTTDPQVARDFREKFRKSMCARFTTVLGPAYDINHRDHFHLDLARHGRDGEGRICK